MDDDGWQTVGGKSRGASAAKAAAAAASSGPKQLDAAAIRAQVAALRAGKPLPGEAPAATAAQTRAGNTTVRAPTARPQASAPTSAADARPTPTLQVQQQPRTLVVPAPERLEPLAPLGTAAQRQGGFHKGDHDYYRAFIKAVLQARGDLVYRFHKTDIVIVRANGDIKLTTGGWYTATTMASMNDVLSEVHIQIKCSGDPREGSWSVAFQGRMITYYDDMVIEATSAGDRYRAQAVLTRARHLGISCYVSSLYVKPAAAAAIAAVATGASSSSAAGVGTGAATSSGTSVAYQQQQQLAGAVGTSAPVPSMTYQQLYDQMQGLSVSGGALAGGPTLGGDGVQGVDKVGPVPASNLTADHFSSLLPDEDELLDDDSACIACMAVARDTIIIPCGHLVLCQACAKGLSLCPMCRTAVAELITF